MAKSADSAYADIVRLARAFLMTVLAADAIALRPNKPRVRAPLTPLADKIFRILVFQFANVLTGLCLPSIATIAAAAGASQSQTKVLLHALARTEYLTWRHGKRKRVKTRKGWRVVRSSNHYRILCPTRHLAALRRWLIRHCNGRHGPLIQVVIARFTPPTEEEKEAEKLITSLAADLRPSAARTTEPPSPTSGADPPSHGTPAPAGSGEIGGVQVADPALRSVLSTLWSALERREAGED